MNGADDVLRRWHPHGWRRLHEPPATTVRVVGVPGSGADELESELRELGGVEIGSDGPAAAVALVVLESCAPAGRTELDLIRRAAAEATEVICALTGIESCPGWRAVRDADIEILHRYAPWLTRVVVLPVSSASARQARESGSGEGAQETLRQTCPAESGIVDLRDALVAAVRSAGDPRRARAAVVAATGPMIREEIEHLGREHDEGDLLAERARLAAARPTTASGPDLRRLQVTLVQDLAMRSRAASAAALEALDSHGVDAAAGTIDVHVGDLRARLADAMAGTSPDAVVPEVARTPCPAAGPRSLEDTLTLVFGASAGAGLGRLIATPFGGLPGWMPLVIAVMCAVPAAGWLVHIRRRIAYRERMRRWITDELAAVRAELDTWIRTRIHEAELQFAAASAAARDRHAIRLRERVASIDAEIARHRGERRARIAACERDLAALGRPAEPRGSGARRTG